MELDVSMTSATSARLCSGSQASSRTTGRYATRGGGVAVGDDVALACAVALTVLVGVVDGRRVGVRVAETAVTVGVSSRVAVAVGLGVGDRRRSFKVRTS